MPREPRREDDDDGDGSKEGPDGSKGPASTPNGETLRALARRLPPRARRDRRTSRGSSPIFEASVLGDDRLRRLFEHKKSREVTEAYGAALRVRACVEAMRREDAFFSRRSRPHNTDAASSSGDDEDALVIFDACSGRGIGSVLLSFWFPTARVVMMDANGAMDLTHVRARSNPRSAASTHGNPSSSVSGRRGTVPPRRKSKRRRRAFHWWCEDDDDEYAATQYEWWW